MTNVNWNLYWKNVREAATHATNMTKAGFHNMGLSIHIAAQRYGVSRRQVAQECNKRARIKIKNNPRQLKLKI